MRPGDRRTKTMDRDPNTESKAQCLAELSRLSLPDSFNGIDRKGRPTECPLGPKCLLAIRWGI